MLLRKAVSPMHLMSIETVMKQLEDMEKYTIPET